jgi:hypothetical protein
MNDIDSCPGSCFGFVSGCDSDFGNAEWQKEFECLLSAPWQAVVVKANERD